MGKLSLLICSISIGILGLSKVLAWSAFGEFGFCQKCFWSLMI